MEIWTKKDKEKQQQQKRQLAAAWGGAAKLGRALMKVGEKSEGPDFTRRHGKMKIQDGSTQ